MGSLGSLGLENAPPGVPHGVEMASKRMPRTPFFVEGRTLDFEQHYNDFGTFSGNMTLNFSFFLENGPTASGNVDESDYKLVFSWKMDRQLWDMLKIRITN